MKITDLGHACFSIETNGTTLIVDIFLTGNLLLENFDLKTLKADYILITHAYQGYTLDIESLAKQTNTTVISNYEITMHYAAKNIKGVHLNHSESNTIDGIKINYIAAIHTRSFTDESYGGEAGGFVIETEDKSLSITGDTTLTYNMKLTPLFKKLDTSILPIGDNFTMEIDNPIIASDFIIIGYHYDTFELIK